MGGRTTPTVVGDFSGTANGTFTYDETQINPDLASQTLILSGMEFTTSPDLHYVADSDPVAHLAYGQFVSLDAFDATCDNYTGEPDLTISVSGTTVTYTIHSTNQTYQGTGGVDLDPQGTVTTNFSSFTNGGGAADADTIIIELSIGGQNYKATVNIGQNSLPGQTAFLVQKALKDKGVPNVSFNGTCVTVKGLQPGDTFKFRHDVGSQNGEPLITEIGF